MFKLSPYPFAGSALTIHNLYRNLHHVKGRYWKWPPSTPRRTWHVVNRVLNIICISYLAINLICITQDLIFTNKRIFVTVKALCVVLYIIGAVSLHYTQHIKVDCVTAFRWHNVTGRVTIKLLRISQIIRDCRIISFVFTSVFCNWGRCVRSIYFPIGLLVNTHLLLCVKYQFLSGVHGSIIGWGTATSRKVAGLIPDGAFEIFHWIPSPALRPRDHLSLQHKWVPEITPGG